MTHYPKHKGGRSSSTSTTSIRVATSELVCFTIFGTLGDQSLSHITSETCETWSAEWKGRMGKARKVFSYPFFLKDFLNMCFVVSIFLVHKQILTNLDFLKRLSHKLYLWKKSPKKKPTTQNRLVSKTPTPQTPPSPRYPSCNAL